MIGSFLKFYVYIYKHKSTKSRGTSQKKSKGKLIYKYLQLTI